MEHCASATHCKVCTTGNRATPITQKNTTRGTPSSRIARTTPFSLPPRTTVAMYGSASQTVTNAYLSAGDGPGRKRMQSSALPNVGCYGSHRERRGGERLMTTPTKSAFFAALTEEAKGRAMPQTPACS